jgi:hypothetical protein
MAYSRGVEEVVPIHGDLQSQVMSTLWRLGTGTVELDRIAALAEQASRKHAP